MLRGIVYRLDQLRKRSHYALRGGIQYASLQILPPRKRPAICEVVVGRNDDYMPDFLERISATTLWNIQHLVDEVIFVEWNPPADRELLSFELAKRFERLKAYIVPREIHEKVCLNPNVPLLEFHAKNVGIRRAHAPWVLVTNADAAFGLDTIRTILGTSLETKLVWTAQRVDIPWTEGHNRQFGIVDFMRYRRFIPYTSYGTGEFVLASKELWEQIRGYDESMVRHRLGCDIRGTGQMRTFGAFIQKAGQVLHLAHATSTTERVQEHHGESASLEGLPYLNPSAWGLHNCHEVQMAARVWRLES